MQHGHRRNGAARSGNGGKYNHHNNAGNIFQYQNAESNGREGFFQKIKFAERFADNGGGTHGKHAAGKNAVRNAPAQKLGAGKAKAGNAGKFCYGSNNCRVGSAFYFIKIIIKPQVE